MHRLNAERWRGGGERKERRRKGGEDGEKVKRGKEENVGKGVKRRCYVRKRREAAVSRGRKRECATVCARREVAGERKRDDAVCRETDGVCAPEAMKGGGEERVEEGDAGRHLPSETKETECENVHGGGKNKALGPRSVTADSLRVSVRGCGGLAGLWCQEAPSFQDSRLRPSFQHPPGSGVLLPL